LLIHKDMVDYGLRVGSVITIDNVHLINEWFWRGFYCCIVSHLLVVSFSTDGTNHHQSLVPSRNRLIKFISQHSPLDKLWLLEAYTLLKNKLT
uniref:Uncharacterized protein n=1 Tax=Amphimedon queenslandica TaxID=400682 RepID=A0A1X7TC84_AMPQE